MEGKESINHHFRRESKLMLWWLLGVPAVLLVLVSLAGWLGVMVLNALR